MASLVLAQRDIDGWIQGIILLLIIGGSILGPIAKKLIETFGGEKSAGPGKSKPPQPPHTPPVITQRRAQPYHPVARPLPSSVDDEEPDWEDVLQPLPPRRPDAVEQYRPPAVPKPPPQPAAPPTHAPPMAAPMSAPRPEARKLRPAEVRRPVQPVRHSTRHTAAARDEDEEQETLESTLVGRLERFASGLEDEAEEIAASIEESLGHVESELAIPEAADVPAGPVAGADERIGILGRRALRRAIVLSEIIGPPVALKPPH